MRTIARTLAVAGLTAGLALTGASGASAAPSGLTFSGAASASALNVNLGTGAVAFSGSASTSFTGSGSGSFSFGSFAGPTSVGTFGPR